LHDVAAEGGQCSVDLGVGRADVGGGGDLAVGVVGVARFAEAEREAVELRSIHDIGHGLGGSTKSDRQDAGGERIERAAVTGLLSVEGASDAVDHVGAGEARRLVDDQPAVERTAAGLAARHGCWRVPGKGAGVGGACGGVNQGGGSQVSAMNSCDSG
jgi:hypothetical protein